MLTKTVCTPVLLVLAIQLGASGSERWTEQLARQWHDNQPWIIGANWVPGYAVNTVETWQADPSTPGANTFDMNQIEFELDLARDTGFNSLRVFLSYEVWKTDRDGFMGRVEQFVSAAADRDIRPSFVLWDDVNFTYFYSNVPFREPYLGPQADAVPGMHNSQWTGTGGAAVRSNPINWELPRTSSLPGAGAKEYVQDLVGTYAADQRVLMWNLYNEPGNSGALIAESSALIQSSAQWARAMDPVQPLSFDIWSAGAGAGAGTDGVAANESDVLSYHNYNDTSATVNGVKSWLSSGRPVFLTEWMSRPRDSTIEGILPYLHEAKTGAYNWGLVNGDTQTHWPWWSPPQDTNPEPDLWFHDLYRSDGTPYRENEIKLFQHYTHLEELLRSIDSRNISLLNPSFEADDLGGVPDATAHRQFQDWTILHEQGEWVGGTIVPDTWHFNEPTPHGSQTMFAVDIEVSQTLGATLEADTDYVLMVSVGHRNGRVLSNYDIKLLAGGTELDTESVGLPGPLEGDWLSASKIFRVDSGSPLVGQPLEIRLSSDGLEAFFDEVRLYAVDSIIPTGMRSDLNLDGSITEADWAIFLNNNLTNLSLYTPAVQFVRGDLNGDGNNDVHDFRLFKFDYESANGTGSFAALLDGIPEPTSLMLFGIGAALSRFWNRVPRASVRQITD